MRRPHLSTIVLLLLFTGIVRAQTKPAPPTVYAESFRKGATRVKQESFEVKLDLQNPDFRKRIKDTVGHDRYELAIAPQIHEGDTKVTAWRVSLADLRYAFYGNVLLPPPEQSTEAENNIPILNPSRYAPIPVDARRIIKVDGFYLVLQVKAFHFTPIESQYLDSMTVDVKLSNTDPRQEDQSNKE
jgi:hypothetical protein